VTRPLVIVGDSLLDVDLVGRVDRLSPDAPVPVLSDATERVRPGGAGLCATLARQAGSDRPVVLVTTLADDRDADRLVAALPDDISVVALPGCGATPVKTRLRTAEHAIARLDRGGLTPPETLPAALTERIGECLTGAAAILVADYGNGTAEQPTVRALLEQAAGSVPVVWDPHPRGPEPVPGIALATPNLAEARARGGATGTSMRAVADLAARLRRHWNARAVAVTLGADGVLLDHGPALPLAVPSRPVPVGDPCGAGDCFAVHAALAFAAGALPSEAVTRAVDAAAGFVAAGGAAALPAPEALPAPASGNAMQVAAEIRARGGTLVATGGCFDLLHAGHVATLEAARRMGDALIVCLNSDASVRRLKGSTRPLQPQADRARILRALSCVDAVAIFDEDTPVEILDRLRPDVWVKGGDYSAETLPEAPLLASWGGQVVAVPYLPERSTTRLVGAARVPL
jgi:rfaE bifunctional protein nucleotidyltransferase chain/domain/rfaE bifunctional protein kinase chain/domain